MSDGTALPTTKARGLYRPSESATNETQLGAGYATLIQPDGPIYFVGDHVSHVLGWQEGAALSALRAVQMVSDRVKAARA
jgi:monoamine oxidase